jgi:hypothetical protein
MSSAAGPKMALCCRGSGQPPDWGRVMDVINALNTVVVVLIASTMFAAGLGTTLGALVATFGARDSDRSAAADGKPLEHNTMRALCCE